MFKGFLTLLLRLLFIICLFKKRSKTEVISQPTEEEITIAIYAEAVDALKRGDSYYAARKFKEVESLYPANRMGSES